MTRVNRNKIFIKVALGLALTSPLFLPNEASAVLAIPPIPCDASQPGLSANGSNSVHLIEGMSREDGTRAFSYGSANNFASKDGNKIVFNFDIIFADVNPVGGGVVKLLGMTANCQSVFGLGPTFNNINLLGSNQLVYDLVNTKTTMNNDLVQVSVPMAAIRYLWIEVWDGFSPSNFATYSYLVDIQNVQNPTGIIVEPEPEPQPTGKRPVLIIPGIMGTEIFKGDEKLWPDVSRMFTTNNDRFMDSLAYHSDGTAVDSSLFIGDVIRKPNILLDYSQNLINDFISQGYVNGENIFVFPYDWRKDLAEIAQQELKNRIDEILFETQFNKIDIVAHSQGGLTIKRLIYDQPEYADKINKIVFVGTPNLGSPKAAKALLYGDPMGVEFLNLGLDPAEVKRIAQNMPSVYQLLPSKEYLSHGQNYLAKAKFIGPLITGYELLNHDDSKQFLKDSGLNSGLIDQAENFHSSGYDNFDFTSTGIQTFNIMGCQQGTIARVLAGNGKYRLTYGPGDSTVPLISASNVFGTENYFARSSNHGTMLTDDGTRQLIVNLISGSNLETNKITQNARECKFAGKKVSVHSPLDIHVYDTDNNHAGPIENGFENNITGVQYDIIENEKFIFLPTDEGQVYRIEGIGIDTGSFDLIITDVENEVEGQSDLFDNIQIVTGSFVSFLVSAESDDSQINLESEMLTSKQFDSEDEAFIEAVSDPAPEPTPNPEPSIPITSGVGGLPPLGHDEEENGIILGENTEFIPDGSLVLDARDGITVYLVQSGKKYGFTSAEVFLGRGYKFRDVIMADLSGYKLEGLMHDYK